MLEPIEQHKQAVKFTAAGSHNLTAFLFDSSLTLVSVEGVMSKNSDNIIVGKHISEALPSELASVFLPHCNNALKGINHSQERHVGDNYFVESFIPLVKTDSEYNVMVVARNLNDLNIFRELRQTQQKLRNVFDSVDDVYFRTELDGTIEICSNSCFKHFGYTRQELEGNNISVLYADKNTRPELLNRIKATGEIKNMMFDMRHKDGHRVNIQANITLITDINGEKRLQGSAKNISNELKTRQKLEEHKSIFENLYNHSGMPIVFAYPDGNLSMVNKNFCEFVGYSEDELLSMDFTQIIHPDDLIMEKQLYLEMLENKSNRYECEKRYITKEGEYRWGRTITSCIRKEDGNIEYLMGAVSDINEPKTASIQLAESEERFRRLFETNTLAIALTNRAGNYLMCNKGMESFVGYTEEELKNQTTFSLSVEEDLESVANEIRKLTRGVKKNVTIRKRYITKSGDLRWGDLNVTIFEEKENDTIFLGVVKDVTDQVEAEQKLNNIFENDGVGIYVVNSEAKIVLINEHLSKFLGYKKGELLGKDVSEITSPKDMEKVVKAIEELYKGGSSFTLKKEYIKKSGEPIYGEMTGSIYKMPNDDSLHILGLVKDISKELKFEEALIESEQKFRKIFENNAIGIATADKHGYYTLCNEGFVNILGYTKEELYKLKSSDITYKDDIAATKKHVKDLLAGKTKSYNAKKRYIKKSGEIIWGEVTVTIFKDPETNEPTLVGVLDDITETVKAQQALKESEEKFRKIFENNGLGVAIVNKKGEYQLVNKGAERILGFTSEEMKHKTNRDITHPDDMEVTDNNFIDLVAGKVDQYNMTKRYIRKDGKTIWGDVTVSLMKLTTQEEPMIIGIMHEITEQKEIEQRLKHSEERFRKIFENNGLAVMIVDSDGKYVMTNKGAVSLLGYSEDEITKLTNKDITHPDDLNDTFNYFNQLKKGEIDSYHIQKRYIKKNKNVLWGDITVSPLGISEGGKQLFIGVIQDITSQKEAEKELQITNQELKILSDDLLEQNLQLENFAHITSHNLRGPLSNLIMLTNVYDKTADDATHKQLVDKFKSESHRMLETLDVLADQIHTRTKANVIKEKLRFNNILKDTISSLSELIEASSTVIEHDFDGCKTIEYPKQYIQSIMLNLLSNAIKYRSNDRTPYIHIKTFKKDGNKYLEIKDNGLGIDLARHESKIFGLYKTFHNHPDSRGVGLFLIKNQIESLGGTITVTSKVNHGTTFLIKF